VPFQQPGERRDVFGLERLAVAGARSRCEELGGQDVAEHAVHAGHRVTDRHGGEGVAVVAGGDGQQAGPLGAAGAAGVLQRHLDRHLHRHRSGVGEEDRLQPRRGDLDEQLGELHRGRVRDAAEHHVGDGVQLGAHGLVENRMAVPVNGRPP